jgi:hypothetical protein
LLHRPLAFPAGPFTPAKPWPYAVYKVPKNGKRPAWEESYQRFSAGEHVDAIAMTPSSGKAVLPRTVRGHVLTALLHGRSVDLGRLSGGGLGADELPSLEDWAALDEGEAAAGLRVAELDQLPRKDLLRAVLGEGVDRAPDAKTDAERAAEAIWYSKIDWWFHLKAAGFIPDGHKSIALLVAALVPVRVAVRLTSKLPV